MQLKTIIDKELESDVKIDQNYGLDLKLNYPNHRRLFESLSQAKIPCIRRISLNYIEWLMNADNFFNSFPNSLNSFSFNYDANVSPSKIDDLVPSLSKCLPKVNYEFAIFLVKMNSNSFNSIIKSCRHMKRVIISCWKIVFDSEIDFDSSLEYKTEYLGFSYTGRKDSLGCSWKSNKDDFTQLLKAIKNSGLSKSLKSLNLYECGWSQTELEEILNSPEIDLSHISILLTEDTPYEVTF